MARPQKYQQEFIDKMGRLFMTGKKSQEDICKEHSIPKSTFSKWKDKHKWTVSEQTSKAISDFVEVSGQLVNIDPNLIEEAKEIISEETKHLAFFQKSGMLNQKLYDRGLAIIEKETRETPDAIFQYMPYLESHSRSTQRNKETVLGKEPSTTINNTNAQQNNVDIQGYGVKVIE